MILFHPVYVAQASTKGKKEHKNKESTSMIQIKQILDNFGQTSPVKKVRLWSTMVTMSQTLVKGQGPHIKFGDKKEFR